MVAHANRFNCTTANSSICQLFLEIEGFLYKSFYCTCWIHGLIVSLSRIAHIAKHFGVLG